MSGGRECIRREEKYRRGVGAGSAEEGAQSPGIQTALYRRGRPVMIRCNHQRALTDRIADKYMLNQLLCSSSLVLLTLTGTACFADTARQPNVLFILADDLGWRDLNVTGSDYYESPNIDRIARTGIQFLNGYATCQVCSPSRASILTGKLPARLHITDWIGAKSGYNWKRNGRILPAEYLRDLPHEEITLVETFRNAGYKTFFAGKWHLGSEGSWPEDHGFDVNRGGHHRGSPPGGFFSPWTNPALENGPNGESLPLRLAAETCEFIHATQDQPFFAFLSFYSVHAPIQTTRDLWQKYRGKAMSGIRPESRFMIDRTLPVRQVQDCPIYAGMIETMDDAVGMVLDMLHELQLTEKTFVVFTSDNGGVSSGDAYATSNLPLRGGKGRQWEGGLRVPYFICGPGLKPATCATPVTGTDFYPTLLELAELPPAPEQHLDGRSLIPLMKRGSFPDRDLFWHYPHYGNQGGEPSSTIRRSAWKLIHYWEDGRRELYNLQTDPRETYNVAAAHPEIVETLGSALQGWLKETDAAIPQTDPRFDPQKHAERQTENREVLMPKLERRHAQILAEDFEPDPTWWGSLPMQD